MIDYHNHVLPNVDDGPDSIDVSLNMLRKAQRQGITDVVNTVHFQHPKMYDKNVDYDYLVEQINKLQKVLNENNINVKLHLSSEVFYLPNLIEVSKNPLNTIGNGKYMLIEFLPGIFPTGYDDQFYKLQLEGITPIVAHPERYKFIKEDIDILKDWNSKGYIVQVGAGSIRGHFGDKIKTISIEMIKKGYVHLIGSDAHNDKRRNFCLKKTYDFLEKNISCEIVDIFKTNSQRVLAGEDMKSSKGSIDLLNTNNNFINRIKRRFKFLN
ncbi:MAG: hypothetical protein CMG66_02790 [Candidatus Marinimicrobia bacterium]|nr:hypothetical protein [Candidatus Neomarinimicrobiota bacterium]|tara:strand:- start:21846 stop:22649 length:804 start_codon:yes stop_codon:yes gene_type:complete